MDQSEARSIALSLPEAVEQDHHGRPSFRVREKIFATLWDEDHMNVMLDEGGILAAAQENPAACREFHWGSRLRAVSVELPVADRELLQGLLQEAWSLKAPKLLLRDLPEVD